ncbi:hypothetical protein E6H25_02865 [Candidatus Bathyarchaeota archaeon]|nr:MAG: hypothetical protein E6H25_02865 [Candidatus Bathyarchaeota archaeon]
MTQKKSTTLILALSVTLLFLVSFTVMSVRAPASGPYYTLGASPSTINEEEGNVRITFTITGGTANTAYTFQFTVTKPGGAGQAYVDESFPTNSTGGYTQVLTYPGNNPVWNPITGTAQTDLPGNYTVTVVETAPKSVTTGFPSAKFTVTSVLTVRLVQVGLTPTTPIGTYSGSYQVQRSDPLGVWNITATAYSPIPSTTNNFGGYSIAVTISPSQLIVSSLSTYNQYGTPTGDFSLGDTLYASFTVAYPTGGYLTTGSFIVHVEDPSGTATSTLSSIYDPTRNLFYTPSGFHVLASDPAGSWELVFPAQSLNDTYGNTGPTATITYRFIVHQQQNQVVINPFYYVIAALAIGGSLGTTVFLKRFNSTTGPFDDLFKLTGGEMQPPATLMIVSDSGAGSTTMALQLLYRDLSRGKFCSLLSYDAFPAEVGRRMRDMGWDIAEYLKTGQLKILDCYSALAGVEGSLIKDPTDFTEVSIQVTGMIEKAKGPVTTLLDSVTPIFNSAAAKDCINFLQVIGAKIKNSGGIFILTVTKGSIPEDVRSKIESMADGVIELNLIKKSNSLRRALQVKKMAGRQTSPVETGFEIVQGKGIVIRRQRVPIALLRS